MMAVVRRTLFFCLAGLVLAACSSSTDTTSTSKTSATQASQPPTSASPKSTSTSTSISTATSSTAPKSPAGVGASCNLISTEQLSNALGVQLVLSTNLTENAQALAQAGAVNAVYGSLCSWSSMNAPNAVSVGVIYVNPPPTESEGVGGSCPGGTQLSGI